MKWRGKRALLNPPGVESTATIVAEIEDTRTWLTGRFRKGAPLCWDDETEWNLQPDYTLKLSDCDRAVTFSLGWDNARKRRAALTKVDTMIDALLAFRAGLVEEQRLYILRSRAARLAGPPPKKQED